MFPNPTVLPLASLARKVRILFMPALLNPSLRAAWLAAGIGLLAAQSTAAATNVLAWQFRPWTSEDGLPNNTVNGLAQTPDGYLWVGTPNGLTRFEVACLASHQAIWRQLLAGGEDRAIVLEDDLHLMLEFAALAGDASWVPADAHSVKLDTYFQTVLLG